MNSYIALLRGINVGGNNIIKMADLKAAFERQGFQNVSTYINSGNILFDCESDEASVKTVCENLIAEDFGLDIPVCVISAAELRDALDHAPDWWNNGPNKAQLFRAAMPPRLLKSLRTSVILHISAFLPIKLCNGSQIAKRAPVSFICCSIISQSSSMFRSTASIDEILSQSALAFKQRGISVSVKSSSDGFCQGVR